MMPIPQTPARLHGRFPDMATLAPIGDVARRLGVTKRALRHYEAIGLIQSRRDWRDVRLFGEDAIEALETIVLLRGIDVPLATIHQIMTQRSDATAFGAAIHDALATALQDSENRTGAIRRLIDGAEHAFVPSRGPVSPSLPTLSRRHSEPVSIPL